jgi:hypothetical protein
MSEERQFRVVVGKFRISGINQDEFEKRITGLVSTSEEYEQDYGIGKGKFIWAFGDMWEKELDQGNVIFARLGKIRSPYRGTIYDTRERSFIDERIAPLRALSYSNFIVHPKTRMILFEEKSNISINQFGKNFSIIYKRNFPDGSEIELELIEKSKFDAVRETKRVFEVLKERKVVEVQFTVTPSNPDDKPEFGELDKILKNAGAKKAYIRIENEEGDLIVEGAITGWGIALSNAGYGHFRIIIEDEGRKRIIESKDKIRREIIMANDVPKELVKVFWSILSQYF